MKLRTLASLLTFTTFSIISQDTSIAHAQGSLTPPPGAPVPVMKSLDQVEARTPVDTLAGDATASHIITLPGSYYLTGPLNGTSGKSGIRIEADNVTIDLNGFTLEAVGGALVGIEINLNAGQVNIRNGQLRFWPEGGIVSPQAVNCQIENVAIRSVGGPGVSLHGPATLRRVQVNGAVGFGILASNSLISECNVENVSVAQPNTPSAGILTESGTVLSATVRNISGNNLTRGIGAGLVRDCTVENVQTTSGHASGLMAVITENGNTIISGVAENCRVRNVGSTASASGIYYFGTVRGCAITGITATNGVGFATGISGTDVSDCQIQSILGTSDVSGISGLNVADCFVQYIKSVNGGNSSGITLDDGFATFRSGVVRHCTIRGSGKYGIFAGSGSVIAGCSVTGISNPSYPTTTGYFAYGTGNLFDGNTAIYCTTGFSVGSNNLGKGNVAKDNSGANYGAGNNIIATTPGSATNAFSNFSF